MDVRIPIDKFLHVFYFSVKGLTQAQSVCKSEGFVANYAVDKDIRLYQFAQESTSFVCKNI